MGCLLRWPVLLLAIIGLVIAVIGLAASNIGLATVAVTAQATVLLNQCLTALAVAAGGAGLTTLAILRNPTGRRILRAVIENKLGVDLPASAVTPPLSQHSIDGDGRVGALPAPLQRLPAKRSVANKARRIIHVPKDF